MSGGGKKNAHHSHHVWNGPRSYGNFFEDVLQGLGITHLSKTQLAADERALASVAHFEGLNNRYNPLNSVVPYGTSTAFNSVGVQDYKNYVQGVLGTDKLLAQGNWTEVRNALKTGNESTVLGAFDTMYQSWGSNGPVAITNQDANAIVGSKIGVGPKGIGSGLAGQVGTVSGGPLNDLLGLGENLASGTANVASAITSPLDFFKTIYSDMTNTDFWIRIGFVVLGFIILLIGIDKLSNGSISGSSGGSASGTIDVVTETTGNAAQSAGNAAKTGATQAKAQYRARTYTPRHSGDKSAAGNVAPGSKAQNKKHEKKQEKKSEHREAAKAAAATAE